MPATFRSLLPAVLCSAALLSSASAAQFVVTSISDSGPGSLRQAILDANAAANPANGLDSITFDLTDLSLIIQVTGSLPEITEPVYIDGSTQINPIDFSFGAPVEIRSTGLNAGESILTVSSAGTSVRKLTFFSTTAGNVGVTLGGTGGHTLEGVTIGISVVNQLSSPLHGIVIASDDNLVQDCRVGGAAGDGIRLTGSRNTVTGCNVGLKKQIGFGTPRAPNLIGIHLVGGAGNVIGALPPSAGFNQISANTQTGIHVEGGTGHRILGNFVDDFKRSLRNGGGAIGNGSGIRVDGGTSQLEINSTVIADTWGTNLAISGPANAVVVKDVQITRGSSHGISVGAGVTGLTIEGSTITSATETGIHLEGNGAVSGPVLIRDNNISSNVVGIYVVSGMGQVTIGTRRDPISAFSNNIWGNLNAGISVSDPVARVRISENALEPQKLSTTDPTSLGSPVKLRTLSQPWTNELPNDVLDADNGPNGLQNKPVITAAQFITPATLNIAGTLNSKPNTTYTIEAHQHIASVTSSGSGNAGYLGTTTVVTDASGNGSFSIQTRSYTSGWKLALTATSPDGETSEYSKSETLGLAPPQFPSLITQTSLSFAENDAATGTPFSLVRSSGAFGAFNASIGINPTFPLDPTPGVSRQPPLKYRLSPDGPWISLNWNTSVSIPFTSTEMERVIYLAAFDDISWDPTNKPGRLGVFVGSSTAARDVPLQFPDNDPTPVFTAVNHVFNEYPTTGPAAFFENSADKNYIRLIADRPSSLYLGYRISLNPAQSTAVSGLDFGTSNLPYTTSVFEGGRIINSFIVHPLEDTLVEGNEIIAFNVTCTTAGITYNAVVPLVIGDNDFYRVSVGDASLAEGNAGTSVLSFPVILPQAIPEAVTFDFATSSLTATAGVDFTAASGTFTLPANSTSGTIRVEMIGDAMIEASETFTLTLSNPSRTGDVVLARATATGTITNEDFPIVSMADRIMQEEAGSISFAVTLDQPTPVAASVGWSITGGTAVRGSDYSISSITGTLNFAAGATTATIPLSIIGDAIVESSETIQFQLSNPTGLALGASTAVLTIQDNDFPTISAPVVATLTEGDTGSQSLPVTLPLSTPAIRAGTVEWSVTADSTAAVAASGTANFAVGASTATFTLNVPGDLVPQASRTVKVSLTNPVELTVPTSIVTVATILDNDQRVILGGARTLAEGSGGMTVSTLDLSISNPLAVPVTVDWQTVNGSAQAGSDFISASGTATIPAGETSTTVPFTMVADSLLEQEESFTIQLSNPVNASIGTPGYVVTITNDDAQPALEIETSNTVTVGPSGNFRAWIEVVLPPDAVYGFSLNWRVSTRDHTALAGTHFTGISNGMLSVPAAANGNAPDPLWIAITVPGGSVNLDAPRSFFVDFTPASGPATVVSAEVNIEPLRVIEFNRLLPQLYSVRFPTGKGQTYVIQEAASLAGPWLNNSSTLLGSGSPVTQTVTSATNRAYFRVRASSSPPAAPVTLGNP